jgi:hypothetical protein
LLRKSVYDVPYVDYVVYKENVPTKVRPARPTFGPILLWNIPSAFPTAQIAVWRKPKLELYKF